MGIYIKSLKAKFANTFFQNNFTALSADFLSPNLPSFHPNVDQTHSQANIQKTTHSISTMSKPQQVNIPKTTQKQAILTYLTITPPTSCNHWPSSPRTNIFHIHPTMTIIPFGLILFLAAFAHALHSLGALHSLSLTFKLNSWSPHRLVTSYIWLA